MDNLKTIMTTAWDISRAAAVKFGGPAKAYIGGALRQAWQAAKTSSKTIEQIAKAAQTIEQIAKAAETLKCVSRASVWQGRRVYVNLCGYNHKFAGDRNLKVFFEFGSKSRWVIDGIKGNMSVALTKSLNEFAAIHGLKKIWY